MYPSNSKWSFFLGTEKKYSVRQAEKTLRIHDYLASVKPSETKWNQVTPKWNRVTPSETEWRQSETKWHQVKPSETEWRNTESKWQQVTPSETEWHQVKPSDTKWNRVTPSEPKWHQCQSDSKLTLQGNEMTSKLTLKDKMFWVRPLSSWLKKRCHARTSSLCQLSLRTTWQNKEQKRSRPCPNISIGRLISCSPPPNRNNTLPPQNLPDVSGTFSHSIAIF